jgi:spoIIIJ-associated protein
MKRIKMKGKDVEAATKAALEVLGGEADKAKVVVLSEGKSGMLGMIGGEAAEVEVTLKTDPVEDAKQFLQEILDKMTFMTMVEGSQGDGAVELKIKGEDMGRIIGKEGSTLKSLETLVSSGIGRLYGERIRVNIDADGYKEKRVKSLERLAKEVVEDVKQSGQEKALPPMSPADRRIIHMYLKDNPDVTSVSKGEGRGRRLVITPR